MAAAIAGEVHYTMLASAETLAAALAPFCGDAFAGRRRSGTKAGEWGDCGPRGSDKSASAVAMTSGRVLWQWLGAGGRFRGAGRAGVRMAKVRDLRARVSGKGQSCAERGPGASFYVHGDGARAFSTALST